VLLTAHLRKHGVLNKINEQVRFARRRFGRYERDRFSGGADRAMRSVESAPWRSSTSDSSRLPSHSWPCLSAIGCPPVRPLLAFLAALTEEPVEALRTLFLDDCSRGHSPPTSKPEGWWIERETPGWS